MDATNNNVINELTFAQREGKEPMPETPELGRISNRFKQLAWLAIETTIQKHTETRDEDIFGVGILASRKYYKKDSCVGNIFAGYLFNVCGKFHTDIPARSPDEDARLASEIIRSNKYHKILTFIEYLLRNEDCPVELHESLLKAFEEAPIAYFVMQTGEQITIAPRTSEQLSESVKQSLKTLHSAGMKGSVTHLHQAAEHINKGQYPASIVNSIHAVESVACEIDPNSNRTLGKALNSLGHQGIIKHHLLEQALHKLSAFANQPSLRHAQREQERIDVGLDEAVLLFGTCASFAGYLATKHHQLQKQSSEDS